MSSVPLAPIQRLIHDVTGDLHVVVAASKEGYRETTLEACLLAQREAASDPRGVAATRAWNRRSTIRL
jgi:hypothetical protein